MRNVDEKTVIALLIVACATASYSVAANASYLAWPRNLSTLPAAGSLVLAIVLAFKMTSRYGGLS